MGSGTSELVRLFLDHIGLIPLLILLLCFAGACIWLQRGRIQILLDRLNLSDQLVQLMKERRLQSEEKRNDAQKELEHLLLKFGHVNVGFPRILDRAYRASHSILLVEDERAVHIYKPALEQALSDSEIGLAKDGAEALEHIARQRPELIVTDIMMPRMSGYEFLAKLSAQYSDIPVLIVSAYIDSLQQIIDRTDVQNLRLEFLAKPFLFRDLLSAIHRLTDNRLRLGTLGTAAA